MDTQGWINEQVRRLVEWRAKSQAEMKDKIRRDGVDEALFGQVISLDHILYSHYGVYVGNNEVIHFSDNKGDFLNKFHAKIRRASIDDFLEDEEGLYVHFFPPLDLQARGEDQLQALLPAYMMAPELKPLRDMVLQSSYKLYEPEETVRRAESKLGVNGYDLFSKNCEHFALWCKTNIRQSRQILELETLFGGGSQMVQEETLFVPMG